MVKYLGSEGNKAYYKMVQAIKCHNRIQGLNAAIEAAINSGSEAKAEQSF